MSINQNLRKMYNIFKNLSKRLSFDHSKVSLHFPYIQNLNIDYKIIKYRMEILEWKLMKNLTISNKKQIILSQFRRDLKNDNFNFLALK